MNAQPPIPSPHAVITDQWEPSEEDIEAGRVPGYGVITNIINGGSECNHIDLRSDSRIAYYERASAFMRVDPGYNLDCEEQEPFLPASETTRDSYNERRFII
ncbi:hypothetical protein AMTRI_Chr09g15710 [Amborella trichopoda]